MMQPRWIEVALVVSGELAEAVAEVLGRYAPGGVVVESTAIQDDPAGEGRPVGPLRVAAYLPADERLPALRRQVEEALWYLGRIQPLPTPQFQPIVERDWTAEWRAHFRPVPVGRRLMVLPPWAESDPGERLPIIIDPGMAFGTGTHPTTQMCLALLEEHLRPGQDLIDVGCGSGVLAIAGIKLGGSQALGVDTDPAALENARDNAALNGVAERTAFEAGSVAEIEAGEFILRRAPLVMANILSPVIVALLQAGLGSLLTPGGRLILSGILADQEAGVGAALHAAGLALQARRQSDDWVALAAVRPGN